MGRQCAAIVSFRLGGDDGVSVEAAKWARALGELGFDVTSVAGAGNADRILPGLAIDAGEPPSRSEVEEALADADLVIVENLCSLPLNPAAGSLVASVLRGRPTVMHHHDLPWQRERFSHFPAPQSDGRWVHVTINQISRLQLASRGIRAFVVRNSFDVDVPQGNRARGRAVAGADEPERLVLQPTRALPRKNVAGGIALAEAIGATFWLLGPAEDGFGPELERVLANAACRVVHGHAPGSDEKAMGDAYAACDLVVLPSTWEGFGNPAVESAVHRRPLAIGHYPVAAELAAFGFRWFAADDARAVAAWLAQPDDTLLTHNHAVARAHFSTRELPARLARVLETAGWEFG